MAAVTEAEVDPGLVVRLDADLLRTLGGCKTNAEMSHAEDRAVIGPHYFLVLAVDEGARRALAVPLFSRAAPGSERLDEAKKGGLSSGWLGVTSYFSRWQHWWIPLDHFAPASQGEQSDAANRRTYASGQPSELEAIAAWRGKNRAAFRPL